jgi:hypothetical protein
LCLNELPWPPAAWICQLRPDVRHTGAGFSSGAAETYSQVVTWSDFDDDTALEDDLLRRALPWVGAAAEFTVDLASGSVGIAVGAAPLVIGPTPEGCMELLGIRPLLTGTAWKVLDLLVEAALDHAGLKPSRGSNRWTIRAKVAKADSMRVPRPTNFDSLAWDTLMRTYAGTEQLRHSIVHRRVTTDRDNALVGEDGGKTLSPMSVAEQMALAMAVISARSLALAPTGDSRIEGQLVHHLKKLTAWHHISTLPDAAGIDVFPIVTVTIDANAGTPDVFTLDVPRLKDLLEPNKVSAADLLIIFRDRPSEQLSGRLEDAPDAKIELDVRRPPAWLN